MAGPDFFVAVWKVNQPLPAAKRLRIVLVDMARPWNEINQRKDWRKYDADRDALMAKNILRDRRSSAGGGRHALFITGATHALLDLRQSTGQPFKSAVWHLRDELGPEKVFVVLQHRPVSSNQGRVEGRVALGLFDSAFAALSDRPIVFPLDHGPFGEQLFDASLDHPTASLYRDVANAYLYSWCDNPAVLWKASCRSTSIQPSRPGADKSAWTGTDEPRNGRVPAEVKVHTGGLAISLYAWV